jgi:hypothetical protein
LLTNLKKFQLMSEKRGPKLNNDQRDALREWLAAEYSGPLIRKWFAEREWPALTDGALTYYRIQWADDINAARTERRASAINSGLALKEERVKRLAEHADELDAIKWLPDEKGRLWNEKSWRETLDDIAKEMGHRRTGVDIDLVEKELDATLDRLKDKLPPEVYAQVLTAIASEAG